MHPRIQELAALFEGFKHAYGAYKLTGEKQDKKVLGKAYSLKGDVTIDLWNDHLNGRQGLGIIPINEKSQVRFAAIDVDEYPLRFGALYRTITDNKLPLVICRTKSGGAHLYLFLSDWHDAKKVQDKMREMAAFLGYGNCEIFPKQAKIIAERGDIGQWINMPYFLSVNTKRYCINNEKETALELDAFLDYSRAMTITPIDLDTRAFIPAESLRGGPPCLQHLIKQGFPDGTRNNGLFNLAVYAKKLNPDGWQLLVENFNTKFMDPPLSMSDVAGVLKSVSKKEFNYMCDQPPIKSYCNRDLCRTCEFGIGGAQQGFPRFGTLTKVATSPPIWFLEVEGGGRLELSTNDLQSPISFQNRCMEILNIMPPLPKRDNWTALIQALLKDVTVVEVPEEMTPLGQLMQHLEDFCTSKVQGKTHDELLLGKPWTNNKKTYFRMKDFMSYLDRQKFKLFNLNYIAMHLREMGGEKHFFNIRGKGVNCYSIPEFINKQEESFPTPKTGEEKPY